MKRRDVLIPIALIVALSVGIWVTVVFLPGMDQRALDQNGVEITATLVSKKHQRGSVHEKREDQFRMVVRFKRLDGVSEQSSHLVTRRFFETYASGETMALVYVPDDPGVQRLDPDYRTEVRRDGIWLIALFAAIGAYILWDNGILRKKKSKASGD